MKAGNGRSEAPHHDVTRGEYRKLHHDTTRREYSLLPDGFKEKRRQPRRGRDRNRQNAFGYTGEGKRQGEESHPPTHPRLQPWGGGEEPSGQIPPLTHGFSRGEAERRRGAVRADPPTHPRLQPWGGGEAERSRRGRSPYPTASAVGSIAGPARTGRSGNAHPLQPQKPQAAPTSAAQARGTLRRSSPSVLRSGASAWRCAAGCTGLPFPPWRHSPSRKRAASSLDRFRGGSAR